MKKLALFILLGVAAVAYGRSHGVYNLEFHGRHVETVPRAQHVFVYNAGTGTVWASFGGHIASSTNEPSTYFAYRLPLRSGSSYTTRDKYTMVSVYTVTNGVVDIGFEGN